MFEEIQKYLRLMYLSDIHFMPFKADAIRYVLQIENEKYSQLEWFDFLQYVTGSKLEKQLSVDQIKQSLSDILKELPCMDKEIEGHIATLP